MMQETHIEEITYDEEEKPPIPADDDGYDPKSMIFYRRPDIHGRQMVLQRRRSSAASPLNTPVQLLLPNGESQLGISSKVIKQRGPNKSAGFNDMANFLAAENERNRQETSNTIEQNKYSRLLVTSNPVFDEQACGRYRHIQLAFLVGACANFILTLAMLLPDGNDTWYHSDGVSSDYEHNEEYESKSMERIQQLRPGLLALVSIIQLGGIGSVYFKRDILITIYIMSLAVSDFFSLMYLLPHMFFILRFLFDGVLMLLAVEAKQNLEYTWFLTNFQRIRY